MACYHPVPAWYSKKVNETGKRGIVFNLSDGFVDKPLQVPCGTCVGCKLERARQWAVRCMHEAKCHENNLFVTLTYDDKNLKLTKEGLPTLYPDDWVQFMYRLREAAGPGIRFFQCGEYGDDTQRPHHHALLFDIDFDDRVRHGSSGGKTVYVSRMLESLWRQGQCTIGDVTFESAGYVARYAMKKVVGPAADGYYRGRVQEYLTMSRRPGIGRAWFDKYHRDWYPRDEMVVNGKPCRPPRYYDTLMESSHPRAMRYVKRRRVKMAESSPDNTGRRLIVREEVKTAAVSTLARNKVN